MVDLCHRLPGRPLAPGLKEKSLVLKTRRFLDRIADGTKSLKIEFGPQSVLRRTGNARNGFDCRFDSRAHRCTARLASKPTVGF